jgi:hypothetical protein
VACGTADAHRDKGGDGLDSATAALIGDDKPTAPGANSPSTAAEDSALRRAYSADDMKIHSCIARGDDGRITGKSCPSAFVVFGPYITVPASSDVQLRFDIEARDTLILTSDVISNGAKQFHGALDEQLLASGQRRTVGYRIHLFDATRSLETRVAVRADEPIDFEITNLEVKVQ